MTRHNAIKKSLDHWKRMFAWAKTQPSELKCNSLEMRAKINEGPSAGDCALCAKYWGTRFDEAPCYGCPLAIIDETCLYDESVYPKECKTWGEWCDGARMMILCLEFLLAFEPYWEPENGGGE